MNFKRRLDFTSKMLGQWTDYVIELGLWVVALLVVSVIYEFAVDKIMPGLSLAAVIGWTAITTAAVTALPAWLYTERRWRKLRDQYRAKLAEMTAEGNRVPAKDMEAMLICRGEYVVKFDLVNDLAAYYRRNDPSFDVEAFIQACGRR